jgi:predicted nuclease of predicted toxin-antitoxin system
VVPEPIRFQLDEHLPPAIAHALARRRIDVATAASAGTVGLPDDGVLARCLLAGGVLVTHDQDFLRLDSEGHEHAGIVYAAHGAFSIGEIVAYLDLVAKVLSPADIAGRVEFVR